VQLWQWHNSLFSRNHGGCFTQCSCSWGLIKNISLIRKEKKEYKKTDPSPFRGL
jgi:hypothetical protein